MSNSVILRRALEDGDLAELSRLLTEDSTIAGRTHSWKVCAGSARVGPSPIRLKRLQRLSVAGLLEAGALVDSDPNEEDPGPSQLPAITRLHWPFEPHGSQVSVARLMIRDSKPYDTPFEGTTGRG